MSIQVINRVNQPLDIYAIKVIDKDQNKFLTKHLGKVRTQSLPNRLFCDEQF